MSVRPANTSDGRSLAGRAASIVVLFVGFYLLALVLALAFLAVPWAQWRYAGGVTWAGIACAAVGLWFLFATLPSWPRRTTERPAPLAEGAHPRLRRLIADVAREVGEPPPDVVYLLPDANAFAAREGGFLGFGKVRRVVGIGLPLLAALGEDEVRSVLAHEFGHHQAGDLRLGPFVHRTRMAVARAIERLDGSSFLLHLPFLLYGQLFLRVSRQISREQELAADALAARAIGREPTARALTRIESLAPRWSAYFGGEVLPLVAGGRRPPMLEGFRAFLENADLRADVSKLLRRAAHRAPREHDTHPPLEERLSALGVSRRDRRSDARISWAAESSALALLDTPATAEDAAISVLLKEGAPRLRPLGWDRAAEDGWLPLWRSALSPMRAVLSKVRVRDIPALYDDPESTWRQLHPGVVSLLSPLGVRRSITSTLGVYLTLVCADAGFEISVPIGGEVVATKDGRRVEPEALVRALGEGRIDRAEFVETVETLEIARQAGYGEGRPKPAASPPTEPA